MGGKIDLRGKGLLIFCYSMYSRTSFACCWLAKPSATAREFASESNQAPRSTIPAWSFQTYGAKNPFLWSKKRGMRNPFRKINDPKCQDLPVGERSKIEIQDGIDNETGQTPSFIQQSVNGLEDTDPNKRRKSIDDLALSDHPAALEEIANAVEIPNERDVGIKVAQHIFARRQQLGQFTNLQQVEDVKQVGPERFSEIIKTLSML